MADESPRLTLPYLLAGQAQKHVSVNDAFALLDALVHLAIESRTTTVQPACPADGAVYLLPPGRTGADWGALPIGALVRWDYGWSALPTPDGLIALVKDEGLFLARKGGAWSELSTGGGSAPPPTELQNLTRLGLGTAADATNPLAAKLNKTLFTARTAAEGGDGDLRYTLNKETPADVLSLLFQAGFSGRAELGLVGDDDLRLKVSADGSSWTDAFRVDRTTGRFVLARTPNRSELTVMTVDGSYAVPSWARTLRIIAIGGGGGGGSGQSGAVGTLRWPGGGGGGGGRAEDVFETADLAAMLSVTIGIGGAGATGGSGAGANGAAGGDTSVTSGSEVLILAGGGVGGRAGTTSSSSGVGGEGGGSTGTANAGGTASANAALTPGANARGDAPGGGGAGGGVETGNANRLGGRGGHGYVAAGPSKQATGGAAGAAGGAAGADGASKGWSRGVGAGGGGGGPSTTGAGGLGGKGGAPGGGGGGGGGATGATAGSGGAGARGEVWILAIG